jgi:hypothetical protein
LAVQAEGTRQIDIPFLMTTLKARGYLRRRPSRQQTHRIVGSCQEMGFQQILLMNVSKIHLNRTSRSMAHMSAQELIR